VLETAVALVLAHLIADFLLQSDGMVRDKQRLPVLLGHVGIVTAVSWVALGFAPVPLLLLLVAATHFAFDLAKLRWAAARRAKDLKPGFAAFATDQAAHLAVIAVAAGLWPGAWGAGLWANPELLAHLPSLARLPEAMALAAGLIATVWTGGYAVRELMAGMKVPADPATDSSLPQGGQLIGRLERLMILMLLLANQPDGIGLLIAAKSILRFNELARDASDRRASEYVIIGTLASFAWAIATAWATAAALRALAP
jgi:hypothetical protein